MAKQSKYVNTLATMQVIGNIYNNPSLLEFEQYHFVEEDFYSDFHKVIFGTIYQLYKAGTKKVFVEDIENFLSSRDKWFGVYKANNGAEYLQKVSELAKPENFNFYYDRLKKMSLLRAYENIGFDMTFIYDPDNVFDANVLQEQEDYLNTCTFEDLVNRIELYFEQVKQRYSENLASENYQAGEGIYDLIERLKNVPDVGLPLYGNLVNTVSRGARLKKFYLRSAPTGVGKSRTQIADACYIACSHIFDENFGWVKTGGEHPTLYISTELEIDEVQTMMLAFLSNVEEDHILDGKYEEGEYERVLEAARLLEKAPLRIELLPNFSLQDIENTIKGAIRDYGVQYVFYDYLHSSLKILEEVSKVTNGMKLREDNILFMISAKLKDICNQYGIFLMSSTQLSNDYKDAETPDQGLLRGSKAIADKIDLGLHLLPLTQKDYDGIDTISGSSFNQPNLKMAIYKNRRGKYKGVYLWCKANLGTCRVNPLYATDFRYNLIPMKELEIILEDKEG